MWLDEKAKDKMKALQEENEKLAKDVDMWNKLYNEEFDKNKKAIKYIKENCEIRRYEDKGIDEIGKVEGMPLLNILQGKDKGEE